MNMTKPAPAAGNEYPQSDSISSRRVELATARDASEQPIAPIRVVLVGASDRERGTRIWEPVATRHARMPSTSDAIHRDNQLRPVLTPNVDAALIATVTQPLHPGETHHEGGTRRERELAAIVMQLDERDAYHLHRRLQRDRADDPIVAAFRRLVIERRQRLRGVLDRRRRALVSGTTR